MMRNLKPCPFCGCEAEVDSEEITGCGYWIKCSECGIEQSKPYGTEEEAMNAWNCRIGDSIEQKKENDTPMEENSTVIQPELFGEEPETLGAEETPVPAPADKPKGKGGRKVISANGEKKSEKLMLYLTPELIGEIRDWCCLKGISAVGYITGLIESDLHSASKQQKLAFFRQLSNEA